MHLLTITMRKIIEETIQSVSTDHKSFTQQLNKMKKECGGQYYLKLDDDEWQALYDIVSTMIERDIQGKKIDNYDAQYNIFRLAKHVVQYNKHILEHYSDYINWYLWTVLHPYRNIRSEWWKFIQHIRVEIFELTNTGTYSKNTPKQAEENKKNIYPFLANVFIYLQKLESDYQLEHIGTIYPKDVYMWKEFIEACDTKDPLLKSIRKWMECRDVWSFGKVMEYSWYEGLYESDAPWFCGWRYLPKDMIHPQFIDEDDEIDEASDEYIMEEQQKRIIKKRGILKNAFDIFVSTYKISLDFEIVQQKIYYDDWDSTFAHREYMRFWMHILDAYTIDPSPKLIDLITDFWNYFPHKSLKGKCPEELYNTL